jgi:hypothetical protein
VTVTSTTKFWNGNVGVWNNAPITIGGVNYTVNQVVGDGSSLILTTPALATLTDAWWNVDHYGPSGRITMWKMSLNANPAHNMWSLIGFSGKGQFTFPPGFIYNNGTTAYSPDNDVIVAYRSNGLAYATWVYCPADGGSLSPAQIAAGCKAPNDWAEVTLAAGTVNTSNGPLGSCSANCVESISGIRFETDGSWSGKKIILTHPVNGTKSHYTIASVIDSAHLSLTTAPGVKTGHYYGLRPSADKWVALGYDPNNRNLVAYGGSTSNGAAYFNETWTYDVGNRRFDLKCRGTCAPPPVYGGKLNGLPEFVYSSTSGTFLYHDSSSASRPSDWEYNPATDMWIKIQQGSGPVAQLGRGGTEAFSAILGDKIATITKISGVTEVWVGTVSVQQQ